MLLNTPYLHESPLRVQPSAMVTWIDFSDENNVTMNAAPRGNFITAVDRSQAGQDFQATSTPKRPLGGSVGNKINGRWCATFNDTHTMRSDIDSSEHDFGSGDFTIIVVCNSNDDERACLLNKGNTPHYQMRFNNADSDDGDFVAEARNNTGGGNVALVDGAITHNDDTARAYMMIRDGSNMRLYWNDVESASSPETLTGDLDDTTGTVYLWIGSRNDATQFFVGEIGEVLIWKALLTSDERALIQRYLERKWGI